MRRILPSLALALTTTPLQAARPLVTDDARLTTAQSCQLETWLRSYGGRQEAWALPACNPMGNFEVTAGVGRVVGGEMRASTDLMVQAKTLLRPLKTNNWGMGMAAGLMHHTNATAGPNGFGNVYAYIPVSASFYDDALIVHTNLGWVKSKGDRHAISWGLSSETRINQRLIFVAEAYGDPRYAPYAQLGMRYFIVPDRVQIDATVGQQIDHDTASRWLSLGLRLTPGKLF